MSDIQNGVDAVRKLVRLIEPLGQVADALDKVGALENAIKEHERDLKKLADQKAKAELNAITAEAKVDAAREQAAKEVAAAQSVAEKIVVDAQSEAVAIKDKAKTGADALIARATADAASAKASLNAQIGELQAKLAGLQGEVEAAGKARDAAAAELEEIEKKVAAAKSKLKAFLE